MAKKIVGNSLIKSANDLITPREETRAGFIAMALEKNYIAVPYIEEAKALKALASQVKKPKEPFTSKRFKSWLAYRFGTFRQVIELSE